MRLLLAVILLACFGPASSPAGDDNPYRKAKVGDWVEYKYTSKEWRAPACEGVIKMTVVAKDDKELTYEMASTFKIGDRPDIVVPTRKVKIDLTRAHDPIASPVLERLLNNPNIKEKDIKATKLGDGREKVKIGTKEYDTQWVHMKYSGKVDDPNNRTTFVIMSKGWISRDAPLSGLVMSETNDGSKTKMVLIGSGRK